MTVFVKVTKIKLMLELRYYQVNIWFAEIIIKGFGASF